MSGSISFQLNGNTPINLTPRTAKPVLVKAQPKAQYLVSEVTTGRVPNLWAKRVGNNLEISFSETADAPADVILQEFYAYDVDSLGDLVGRSSDGVLRSLAPVDQGTTLTALADGYSGPLSLSTSSIVQPVVTTAGLSTTAAAGTSAGTAASGFSGFVAFLAAGGALAVAFRDDRDTAPPAQPTLTLASDTGAGAKDGVTSAGAVNVRELEPERRSALESHEQRLLQGGNARRHAQRQARLPTPIAQFRRQLSVLSGPIWRHCSGRGREGCDQIGP